METPYRSSRIADLSAEDRPREKALAIGVEALTTTELVALLLGSGTPGESGITRSQRILADSGNSLQELSRRTTRTAASNIAIPLSAAKRRIACSS